MPYGPEPVLVADLCAPSEQAMHWTELGYRVYQVECTLIAACASRPGELDERMRAQLGNPASILIVAGDRLPVEEVIDADWSHVLHEPLARCFTLLRGLVPHVCASGQSGRVIALLPCSAVLPDVAHGTAAVLGRALLGLFESLRAEMARNAVRVSICFVDPNEPAGAFHSRLRHVLANGPLYSTPPSFERGPVEAYFGRLMEELAVTPEGVPLPALGPQGDVYRAQPASS